MDACAREPVHSPGAIQPVGCLISLDAELGRVRQVSANLETYLDVAPEQALTASARRLLGGPLIERLQQALLAPGPQTRELTVNLGVGRWRRRFHVIAYRSGQRVVVELEPLLAQNEHHLLAVLNRWLITAGEASSVEQLHQRLVEEVHRLTGLDRIMLYRFDEYWNGSVVAESRTGTAQSFLGHHFPASDIPAQVRRLYDINRLRSIPDAAAAPVPLIPAADPLDPAPLDLSPGILRAVSPIHQTYLSNMGVATALSVALHDDEERLGGLLTCHGLTPQRLSPGVRDTVRALVQIAVPQLMLLHTKAEARLMGEVKLPHGLQAEPHGQLINPAQLLQQHGETWLSLFGADGIALYHRQRHGRCGSVPEASDIEAVIDWLPQSSPEASLWHSHCLKETPLGPWRGQSCGLLAVPLPLDSQSPSWLLLFRDEQVDTRRWAGEPCDQAEYRNARLVLTPRRSFAEWQEAVHDQSRVWRRITRRAAVELADNLATLIASHEIQLLNARLRQVNDRLAKMATHDNLTGAWNRYGSEEAIDAEIAAAERYHRPCALLLFDVDHFKVVNDRHGHDIGDQVLARLAAVVRDNLRESDHLGRWGGEEFLVLATSTDADGARELAERLRSSIAGTDFGQASPVTISIGIADFRQGDTPKTLVKRADDAMYQAKQAGRNCVRYSD
nr:sensor domain-containing diguanylate cyclase [Halomonas campisalis]